MPNFVDCWNSLKAKGYKHADGSEVLNDQDRASIEARIQEHLRTGLDPIEAAKASVKSHLDEAHAQLQSIYDQVVPKAPEIVQRIEEPGVGRATVDKPHGIYTTPIQYQSPHADLGGAKFQWELNPDAKVLDVTGADAPPMRQMADVSSPGVAAAKKLLPPEIGNLIRPNMGKPEAIEIAKARFPNVDWNRYYDAQEVIEGLGGMEAKKSGYDIIRGDDPKFPEFSERILLTEKAGKPVSEAGQAPAVAGQPKTEGGTGEEKVQVQGQEKGRVLAETPAVPPETPEQLGQALSEKPRLAGPSNRVLQERAARGEIPQAPESGTGVLKEDLVRKANERYSPERAQVAGEKAMRGETTLDDDADIVLHEEKLSKVAADAERAMKANPNDPVLQQAHAQAEKAMTDWQHGPIAAIKEAWNRKGINLQGATDVDTGTLVGLQRLAWATGKGDIPVEQRPIFDEAANRVTKSVAEEKASIVQANEAVQKVLKPSRYMDLNQLRESLAETLKSITC